MPELKIESETLEWVFRAPKDEIVLQLLTQISKLKGAEKKIARLHQDLAAWEKYKDAMLQQHNQAFSTRNKEIQDLKEQIEFKNSKIIHLQNILKEHDNKNWDLGS